MWLDENRRHFEFATKEAQKFAKLPVPHGSYVERDFDE